MNSDFKKGFGIPGIFIFVVFFSLTIMGETNPLPDNTVSYRFNPEYKIKRMSNGEIVVFKNHPQSDDIKHKFSGLSADLLFAIYRKQSMSVIENSLSKKYYLSYDECRREIKHAINVFAQWNIVLIDETSK
jgi:hypothetical protein